MKLPVALALVVGIAGGVIAYLYVGPLSGLGLFIPATFLGAASYFAAGHGLDALKASVPANLWGIAWATLALILLAMVSSPAMVGLIVGGVTAAMILGALIPGLRFVPGQVVGLATTAAYGLLTKASGTDFSLPSGPFTVMALSFIIGGTLGGYLASTLVAKLVTTTSSPTQPA